MSETKIDQTHPVGKRTMNVGEFIGIKASKGYPDTHRTEQVDFIMIVQEY